MTTHSQFIPNNNLNQSNLPHYGGASPYGSAAPQQSQQQQQQQYGGQMPPSGSNLPGTYAASAATGGNPAQQSFNTSSYGLGLGGGAAADRGFKMSSVNNSPMRNSQQILSAKQYEEDIPLSGESQSRVSYLRRLYLAVFAQTALASLFTYLCENSIPFRSWILTHTGVSLVLCLIIVILLSLAAFFQKYQLSKPFLNIAVFVLYTLGFATLVAYFDASYSSNVHYFFLVFTYLFAALFFHALLCLGPITFQNAALFIFAGVLFITLKLEIFSLVPLQTIYIISTVVIILGFYIVWENETVISGTKTEWSREDPIIGSIGFFLNLFTLFLRLANLISKITVGGGSKA